MLHELTRAYWDRFDRARWESRLAEARRDYGDAFVDSIAPRPLFLPGRLVDEMMTIVADLVARLRARPWSDEAAGVDARWRLPASEPEPALFNVDFALARGPGGAVVPRVLELQGFASAYASSLVLGELYAHASPGGLVGARSELGARGRAAPRGTAEELVGRMILGGHPPEQVALVDIEPTRQRNWIEFVETERRWGVRPWCITQLERRGEEVGVVRGGHFTAIRRLYSRVVPDELDARGGSFPWAAGAWPAVEWVDHPGWFFRWSKAALLAMEHPAVPPSRRLDQLNDWPDDLERWVLKPLYSYAGRGVVLGPTREQLDAIAEHERRWFLLMRRVDHARVVRAPPGSGRRPQLAEVRMLCALDEGRPAPVSMSVRVGDELGVMPGRQGLGCAAQTTIGLVVD